MQLKTLYLAVWGLLLFSSLLAGNTRSERAAKRRKLNPPSELTPSPISTFSKKIRKALSDDLLQGRIMQLYFLQNVKIKPEELYKSMAGHPDLALQLLESRDPVIYALIPDIIVLCIRGKDAGLLKQIMSFPRLMKPSSKMEPLSYIIPTADLFKMIIRIFGRSSITRTEDLELGSIVFDKVVAHLNRLAYESKFAKVTKLVRPLLSWACDTGYINGVNLILKLFESSWSGTSDDDGEFLLDLDLNAFIVPSVAKEHHAVFHRLMEFVDYNNLFDMSYVTNHMYANALNGGVEMTRKVSALLARSDQVVVAIIEIAQYLAKLSNNLDVVNVLEEIWATQLAGLNADRDARNRIRDSPTLRDGLLPFMVEFGTVEAFKALTADRHLALHMTPNLMDGLLKRSVENGKTEFMPYFLNKAGASNVVTMNSALELAYKFDRPDLFAKIYHLKKNFNHFSPKLFLKKALIQDSRRITLFVLQENTFSKGELLDVLPHAQGANLLLIVQRHRQLKSVDVRHALLSKLTSAAEDDETSTTRLLLYSPLRASMEPSLTHESFSDLLNIGLSKETFLMVFEAAQKRLSVLQMNAFVHQAVQLEWGIALIELLDGSAFTEPLTYSQSSAILLHAASRNRDLAKTALTKERLERLKDADLQAIFESCISNQQDLILDVFLEDSVLFSRLDSTKHFDYLQAAAKHKRLLPFFTKFLGLSAVKLHTDLLNKLFIAVASAPEFALEMTNIPSVWSQLRPWVVARVLDVACEEQSEELISGLLMRHQSWLKYTLPSVMESHLDSLRKSGNMRLSSLFETLLAHRRLAL